MTVFVNRSQPCLSPPEGQSSAGKYGELVDLGRVNAAYQTARLKRPLGFRYEAETDPLAAMMAAEAAYEQERRAALDDEDAQWVYGIDDVGAAQRPLLL